MAPTYASQLNALLANLAEGVVILDAVGTVILANQAAREIMGVAFEEAQGALTQDLGRLSRQDGTPLPLEEQPIRRALKGERFAGVEAFFLRPDGARRCLLFAGAALRDEAGRVRFALVLCHDISERRELEGMKDEYLSIVSHDLRAPLTVILGQAQMIQRLADREHPVFRSADAIVMEARRMNRMIQDLVDSARLESGQVRRNCVRLDLRAFLLEMRERMGEAMDAERIRVEASEDIPAVLSDPNDLERILMNLLTNALKYSDSGTEVTVTLVSRGGEVVTSVSDLGPGISPEELPHLFQRYHRTRRTRGTREGLGLGLYITRMLVEAYGGNIWVESEVGKGSTFHFSLPASTLADVEA